MKHVWSLVLVSALLAAGCLPAGLTTGGSALIHPKFPYAVVYDDPEQKSVLGNDWRLENYRKQRDEPGKPAEIERKEGYDTTYELDFNDDDEVDARHELPYPDLVFLHKKTNARLEVATVLLGEALAQKELRVLLDDIVESQSGTRSLFVGIGRVAAGVEKRFASRLLDSEEATLGGQKGLAATFERADVDQLQLNPKARWRRSRLFLMHAPFDYYAGHTSLGADSSNASASVPSKLHKYRVLLAVEYTNTPEDFEAQYPDFVRLLNKTHMLTDPMLLAYLGEPLKQCSSEATSANLSLSISERGGVNSVKDSEGLDPICTSTVVGPYPFAATGEAHLASAKYDFAKPQKPEWLTQEGYVEQRKITPPDAASPDATSPDAAKPDASPSPATAPTTTTPDAPSTAPAGTLSTPSSDPTQATPVSPK